MPQKTGQLPGVASTLDRDPRVMNANCHVEKNISQKPTSLLVNGKILKNRIIVENNGKQYLIITTYECIRPRQFNSQVNKF